MESDDEGGKRRLERRGVLEWERGLKRGVGIGRRRGG